MSVPTGLLLRSFSSICKYDDVKSEFHISQSESTTIPQNLSIYLTLCLKQLNYTHSCMFDTTHSNCENLKILHAVRQSLCFDVDLQFKRCR
ncbi:hypothetical protein AQUCO_01600321v1 [Aquilegia coerulea]|uniref:Uncharacterized protein n=1 Tax=Aquilegia coerulea TaxID=218851 RepID=A0A2G5DRV9_AQUCA|nr:hypothetical protein AQUCO_01600321v1 [Aquilegia coerulea]